MKSVLVKNSVIGPDQPLVIMCGPCVIESEDHCMRAAESLKGDLCDRQYSTDL